MRAEVQQLEEVSARQQSELEQLSADRAQLRSTERALRSELKGEQADRVRLVSEVEARRRQAERADAERAALLAELARLRPLTADRVRLDAETAGLREQHDALLAELSQKTAEAKEIRAQLLKAQCMPIWALHVSIVFMHTVHSLHLFSLGKVETKKVLLPTQYYCQMISGLCTLYSTSGTNYDPCT